MLSFQEIYLNTERNTLTVTASVLDVPVTKNVFLDRIDVYTQSTYRIGDIPEPNYTNIIKGNIKSFTWVIELNNIKDDVIIPERDLIFIEVHSKGLPESGLPCGLDHAVIYGVAYNQALIFNQGLCLAENTDVCNPNEALIDYILRYNGLKMAIGMFDVDKIKQYWSFFVNNAIVNNSKKCNCNG